MPKPIPCRPLWLSTARTIILAPFVIAAAPIVLAVVLAIIGIGYWLTLTGGGK